MELQKLNRAFTVCKIERVETVDFSREFVFLSKTDQEISLVCESAHVPSDPIAAEAGWQGLKISGVLDFGMIGVLAKIAEILARAGISIFVVSTYNTDYIFIKAEKFEKALGALMENGYTVK